MKQGRGEREGEREARTDDERGHDELDEAELGVAEVDGGPVAHG